MCFRKTTLQPKADIFHVQWRWTGAISLYLELFAWSNPLHPIYFAVCRMEGKGSLQLRTIQVQIRCCNKLCIALPVYDTTGMHIDHSRLLWFLPARPNTTDYCQFCMKRIKVGLISRCIYIWYMIRVSFIIIIIIVIIVYIYIYCNGVSFECHVPNNPESSDCLHSIDIWHYIINIDITCIQFYLILLQWLVNLS